MRKKLIGLVFLVLGSISAISACSGNQECSKDEDCGCNGNGICVVDEEGGTSCYCPPE